MLLLLLLLQGIALYPDGYISGCCCVLCAVLPHCRAWCCALSCLPLLLLLPLCFVNFPVNVVAALKSSPSIRQHDDIC
jgi:hypothetical protein